MATDLYTAPSVVEITTDMIGAWEVTFAAAMAAVGAASITSCAAALFPVWPGAQSAVSGFVTSATPDGTSVNVTWDGSVLQRSGRYQLQTRATFDTGAAVEFLTDVRCVA